MNIQRLPHLLLVALLALTACQMPGGKPDSAAAARIDRDVDAALRHHHRPA